MRLGQIMQVFSPVAAEVHAATQIHSGHQATNETLQEYIL